MRGDTISDLARQIDVPADELEHTVQRCQFIISHGSIIVCPPGSPRLWANGIWKYAPSDATEKSVSRPR
jgi:hypothetical protein